MSSIRTPKVNETIFNIRDDKTIYLGIPVNILCADRFSRPNTLGMEGVLEKRDRIFNNKIDYKLTIRSLRDTTTMLYLGKIIFEKNRDGNLAPKYIPSHISESSLEGLNPFWLNELNPNAKKPFKSLMECERDWDFGEFCRAKGENIPYQKIHYHRSKDNIVLNKEQMISYFSELHRLNTTSIKNHIDSINKHGGIEAYYLYPQLYEKFLQGGLLQEDMMMWGREAYNTQLILEKGNAKANLLVLDYLKRTNQANTYIPLFDELFYPYLVWSLKEYLLSYFVGRYQEDNHLLFNAGAYTKYQHMIKKADKNDNVWALRIPNPYYSDEFKHTSKKVFSWDIEVLFYTNIVPTKYEVGYIEGYEHFFDRYGYGVMTERKDHYFPDLPRTEGYFSLSPNEKSYDVCIGKVHIGMFEFKELKESEQREFLAAYPSPLGYYYFELTDNLNTFVEYYPRIYPSITTPPKGWSKEMMKKLELTLE